jgi:class 3 adenylate cyclase/tetratricopeptide (TPR) repeat protein
MRQERKIVTVLFCDLVGFTSRAEAMDPEDVAALLAPYQAGLRRELVRYGGTVEKFIGDAVMALFGAPTAHEHDPERAVRAALAIREFAAAEGIGVRIGVNTGEALVAVDAKPEQGETMAIGDVINTAARLEAAAPVNGILVGEATYRASERVIDYEAVDAVGAKGKAKPVPAWLAVAPRSRLGVDVRDTARTPLVGRELDRELLASALTRVRSERRPHLVTIVGVPGVGKSRLVYELYRIADKDPALIVWRQGRSLPYGEGVAFWALGEIVKAQAGILELASAEEAGEKLSDAVRDVVTGGDAEWVERALRPLVGLGGEGEQGLESQAMTTAGWRRFFQGLAERAPTVLVFEDLQWADDALLDFVDGLVDGVTGVPLLVLCTARPEFIENHPGWGGEKRNALLIPLPPLSDEDTARLIAALLDRPVLPAEEQALLLQRAGGNPLFAEEYARMLAEGALTPGSVPETLQGVVATRVDALPVSEKELLQQAALLGKVFWTDALSALTRLDGRALRDPLVALERKEFIRREPRSAVAGAQQYAFLHVLVRDGAYGQMPRAARAQAHLRAADWIDSLPPDRAEDRAEMLAHHLVQALEYGRAAGIDVEAVVPRAVHALRDAGDRASALGALASGLELYERAIALDPSAEDDPYLLLRHGRALALARGQGEDELARAVKALRESDPATAAEAELLWGESIWQRGDQEGSFAHFDRAADMVAELPASRQKLVVVSQVGRFQTLAGRLREGLKLVEQAITMAEELGDDELLGDAFNTRGVVRSIVDDDRWIDDMQRSLDLALEVKSWRAGRAYINIASTLIISAADLERAERLTREGLRFAEGHGIGLAVRWSRSTLAEVDFHLGSWDEVVPLADEEIADPNPHYMQSSCRRYRSLIRLARGDRAGALEDVEAGLKQSRAIRDPQDLVPALAWRSYALARLGDLDTARATIAELADMQTVLEQREAHGPSAVLLAYAAITLEDDRAFDQVRRLQRHTGWRDAARAIVDGDLIGAAERLAAVGSKAFAAEARLEAARELRERRRIPEAEAQLAEALLFYRAVGATAAIREGEELLAAAS